MDLICTLLTEQAICLGRSGFTVLVSFSCMFLLTTFFFPSGSNRFFANKYGRELSCLAFGVASRRGGWDSMGFGAK